MTVHHHIHRIGIYSFFNAFHFGLLLFCSYGDGCVIHQDAGQTPAADPVHTWDGGTSHTWEGFS